VKNYTGQVIIAFDNKENKKIKGFTENDVF
jgi:hypothetical protein